MDTVWEMVVAVARLEKRPIRVETPAKASGIEQVLPPLPPPTPYPHIPPLRKAEWSYEIPKPRMLVGVPLPK